MEVVGGILSEAKGRGSGGRMLQGGTGEKGDIWDVNK